MPFVTMAVAAPTVALVMPELPAEPAPEKLYGWLVKVPPTASEFLVLLSVPLKPDGTGEPRKMSGCR